MWGSATLVTLVSRICMTVISITVSVIIHLRNEESGASVAGPSQLDFSEAIRTGWAAAASRRQERRTSPALQIGRASCRERVEKSVGSGSRRRKTHRGQW